MKRKLRKGYCNCGGEVQFSNTVFPYKMECPLCGTKIFSYKTFTGKLIIYFMEEDDLIKAVVSPPKGRRLNDRI